MKTAKDDVEPLEAPFPESVQEAQRARLRAAWKAPSGFRYWSAVNNTEVGVWYTATGSGRGLC